jgi:hypothetical protein
LNLRHQSDQSAPFFRFLFLVTQWVGKRTYDSLGFFSWFLETDLIDSDCWAGDPQNVSPRKGFNVMMGREIFVVMMNRCE